MEKINTFVIPIIVPTFIDRFLDTLYQYTPENFNVIVIDQTYDGMVKLAYDKRVQMYIRPHRNLGFAHAMNTGMRIAGTDLVTCANDDVELINPRWWQGIEDEFKADLQIGAVNPMSIAEPGWGYGCNRNSPDELVAEKEKSLGCKFDREKERFEHLPYKEIYTNEDYDYLLSKKHGCIDGIITWFTTFRMDVIGRMGKFDERFFPGGGEDYDLNARFYSKWWPSGEERPEDRYRMVATSRSWAWHHLSSSRNYKGQILPGLREHFGDDHAMWEDRWSHPTLAKIRKDEVKRVIL